MADQLNHKYELLFGQPVSFYGRTNEQPNLVNPSPLISNTRLDTINSYDVPVLVNTKDANALALTEHNIAFTISKAKENGKESKITIYNISDKVREYLEAKAGNKVAVVLRAGYETDEDLKLLFQGEVLKVLDNFQGHTRVTEVQVKSGYGALLEAYTVKSFKGGVSVSQVIRDTLADLKLPQGTVFIPKELDVIIDKPVVINSKTKDFLDRFAKLHGMKVFVEDSMVNVIPDNYVMQRGTLVYRLSVKDGNLIGSPSIVDNTDGVGEIAPANRTTLKVITTLNGSLQIGNKVVLESKFHNGVYEIESMEHRGVYEGSEWQTELQIKPVDGWEDRG